ncbi:AAA family ATPase [Streptomyces sp. NPDC059009]|uniref:nSTAND1 domain-containing NTPase n=1 Tax=Streptomyces sp. NPDC059009 TaxID=3346694 RepID=UPI0036987F32
MDRRRAQLAVNVLALVATTLLGMAANYATSRTDHVPWILRVLRDWSLPLLGGTILLLIGCAVWLHVLERPVAAVRRAWDATQPPYPGLEAFTEADSGVFFGRDREVRELVARLHPVAGGRPAGRVVSVIGPSGSGKSSLVLAGLLPALARRRERWVVVPPFTPGEDPVGRLETALAEALPERGGPVLIVVDQLEELFTLAGPRERDAFLVRIGEAVAARPRLWVVATLRSDFLTDLLETGYAGALGQQPLLVSVLGRAEIVDVIEKPGEQAGLTFAPGLVARMVDDTGGGDALPLLAYTLQALYLRARAADDGVVREADYLQLGGVAGALAEQADRIADELRGADPGAPVLGALLKFVTLEHGEPTRRRVRRGDLAPGERAVVDAFVAGRLLTSDGDVVDVSHEALFRQWAPLRGAVAGAAEMLRRRTELERSAQDWEHSGRRDGYLLGGERLAVTRGWVAAEPEAVGGGPLVAAFLEESIRRDSAAMAQVADAVARRAIEGARGTPELALLAALAAAEECAPIPVVQRALHTALNSTWRCAVLRCDGGNARAVAWSPDGARLAVAYEDGKVRVWASGPDDVAREPVVLARTGGAGDNAFTVAWSPDGKRLAAGYRDCLAVLWDTEDWSECLSLGGSWGGSVTWSADSARVAVASREGVCVRDAGTGNMVVELAEGWERRPPVWRIAWSWDGAWLAGAGDDGTVLIWGTDGQEQRTELREHRASVAHVAWSSDGKWLASVAADRRVVVWRVPPPGESWEVAHVQHAGAPLPCVTWAPSRFRLAYGDNERTVHLWDLSVNTAIWLDGHTDCVNDISWHGDRIATASRDGTVSLWDAEAPVGGEEVSLRGVEGLRRVEWLPDGERLFVVADSRRPLTWDVSRRQLLNRGQYFDGVVDAVFSPDEARLLLLVSSPQSGGWTDAPQQGMGFELIREQTEFVSVTWSPDGTRVATTENNGDSRIWDAAERVPLLTLEGDRQSYARPAWSPDGTRLATSLTRGSACVWDTRTGERLTLLEGHGDYTWSLAWSPDGRRVATGSRDRMVRIWDPYTGAKLTNLRGHEERVAGVAWSPDGRRLATASWDHTVRLWDPNTGRELAVVGVHNDQVNDLAWSPDGTLIATVSRDRTVRVWRATEDVNGLLERARSRAFRDLTAEERRSLLLPARASARRT